MSDIRNEQFEQFKKRLEEGPSPEKYDVDFQEVAVATPVTETGAHVGIYDLEVLTDNVDTRDIPHVEVTNIPGLDENSNS